MFAVEVVLLLMGHHLVVRADEAVGGVVHVGNVLNTGRGEAGAEGRRVEDSER